MKLFTYKGINLNIHWSTFILFLCFITSPNVEYLFALYTYVVLHEFGHALQAIKLGCVCKDITIYPFGGIAFIERLDSIEKELLITLAGPLVNFWIAFNALGVYLIIHGLGFDNLLTKSLLICYAQNLLLFAFNMLPIGMMDGGRITKCFLQKIFEKDTALFINFIIGCVVGIAIIVLIQDIVTSIVLTIIIALSFIQFKVELDVYKSTLDVKI